MMMTLLGDGHRGVLLDRDAGNQRMRIMAYVIMTQVANLRRDQARLHYNTNKSFVRSS
jgi:N-acetylmuramic acid 6-phosphate (MurNAc-6-P) etherase